MKRRRFLTVTVGVLMLSAGLVVVNRDVAAIEKATPGDLEGVTQNWDKTLPANDPGGPCPNNSSRFTCVFGGAAVRDNETGLVWEQSPSIATQTWTNAVDHCAEKTVGRRKGWRSPSFAELASLVDPTVPSPGVSLPPGHPFADIQFFDGRFWTATTDAATPTNARQVNIKTGSVGSLGKATNLNVWCVRGGMNADQY